MAKEEEKAEGGEAAAEPKGGKKKLIIIIVAVLVLLGGGAGAFFALSGKGGEEGEDGEEIADEEEEGAEGEGELPGAVFPLEVFIVNLGVKGSFLKTAIQLEFATPEPPHTIETDVPKIRDGIIKILSSKTSSDILTVEGKEKLREELLKAVNGAMGSEEVVNLYFTEFIVQ